jgi:uncharacterized DUF497 family protein
MRVTFDPGKRAKTFAERGLDFADAAIVFEGTIVEFEDTRKDYGEPGIICYGLLQGPHGSDRVYAERRYAPCFQHAKGQPS